MPDLAGVADVSPRKETFRLGAIESRMHAAKVIERLRNPHPARQHGDIGDEADIAHEPIALGPGVASENLQFSLIWGEAENRVERSGLSCAVGTDESKNAALFDTQIDAVEREGCAEGLAEAACFDDCHDFGSSGTFDGRRFAAPFSKSSAVRPSRSMVAETLGHSSARNFWRSPCSSRLRAPTLMNMPRPLLLSTSCSSTSC